MTMRSVERMRKILKTRERYCDIPLRLVELNLNAAANESGIANTTLV